MSAGPTPPASSSPASTLPTPAVRVSAVRVLAAVVAVAGAAGFLAPVRKVDDDLRLVRSPLARELATAADTRLTCLRELFGTVPVRPTYVPPDFEPPGAEWYQRGIEMAFGQVPLVADPADAEQVVQIVVVPAGTGACGDLDVRVRPR